MIPLGDESIGDPRAGTMYLGGFRAERVTARVAGHATPAAVPGLTLW